MTACRFHSTAKNEYETVLIITYSTEKNNTSSKKFFSTTFFFEGIAHFDKRTLFLPPLSIGRRPRREYFGGNAASCAMAAECSCKQAFLTHVGRKEWNDRIAYRSPHSAARSRHPHGLFRPVGVTNAKRNRHSLFLALVNRMLIIRTPYLLLKMDFAS